MNSLFYNSILNKHRDLADKDNCKVAQVFELMLLFCSLALMLVGTVLEDYGDMQLIYMIYIVISLVLFLLTRYYVSTHLYFAPTIMILVLMECYSYCIFSGILFNRESPSITVYALMVAACSAFTVGFSFTVIFHTIAAVIYCT
ncbi:MAG: hypothetical protein Q4B70_19015, partial [Lachnospiraceae bacterium]|nr:hypothetical protein [Lachnospiraceae bacterium]